MSWIISKQNYWEFINTSSSKWREKGNFSFNQNRFDDSIREYTLSLILANNEKERPLRMKIRNIL